MAAKVFSAQNKSSFSGRGSAPGRGTTDAIFVIRQLQEKYLAANKRLYMAFVDLEKVIWWSVGKICNPHPHPRWKTRVGIL